MKVSGNREKMCIAKENNFAQAGARFRSFDPARQERFINRIAGMLTAPRVTQVCCQLKHQLMLLFSTASVQHMPVSLQPLVVANSESGLLTSAQAFQIADVPCCCRMLNWSCFYVFRQCRPAVNCILMCELPALIHMRRLTAAQTHCSADSLQAQTGWYPVFLCYRRCDEFGWATCLSVTALWDRSWQLSARLEDKCRSVSEKADL